MNVLGGIAKVTFAGLVYMYMRDDEKELRKSENPNRVSDPRYPFMYLIPTFICACGLYDLNLVEVAPTTN
jgi:hypothetical protein